MWIGRCKLKFRPLALRYYSYRFFQSREYSDIPWVSIRRHFGQTETYGPDLMRVSIGGPTGGEDMKMSFNNSIVRNELLKIRIVSYNTVGCLGCL